MANEAPPEEALFRPELVDMLQIEELTLSSGKVLGKASRLQLFNSLLLLEINQQLFDMRLLLTNPRGQRETGPPMGP